MSAGPGDAHALRDSGVEPVLQLPSNAPSRRRAVVQRLSQDPRMLSWMDDANNRLLVYTPRVTDSPLFSPCANEAGKDAGTAHRGGCQDASPSGPPPAPSCDARSAASEDPGTVPVLHDLEQHFCSAFLDDDFVPREEQGGAAPLPMLPAGLLAQGVAGADGPRSPRMTGKPGVDGYRRSGPGKQGSNLETGLSFFGPATAHSHFPEELGRMVEIHHFVVAADDRRAGELCSTLPTLRAQLEARLMGVPPMR